MKKFIAMMMLVGSAFVVTACGDDEDTTAPVLGEVTVTFDTTDTTSTFVASETTDVDYDLTYVASETISKVTVKFDEKVTCATAEATLTLTMNDGTNDTEFTYTCAADMEATDTLVFEVATAFAAADGTYTFTLVADSVQDEAENKSAEVKFVVVMAAAATA